MHISEGVLSGPVLAAGAALTLAGTALGLRAIRPERIMVVALLAAAFFLASLIHVPVGPVSAHLLLLGLLGLILGRAAFPAILVGLLLQAALFQYGGLVVLGANAANMALPAILAGAAARPFLKRGRTAAGAAAFACGAGAILLSALMTAACLALSGEAFLPAARLVVLAHLPVAAVEGAVTLFAASFLTKVRPEILEAAGS